VIQTSLSFKPELISANADCINWGSCPEVVVFTSKDIVTVIDLPLTETIKAQETNFFVTCLIVICELPI
jgi:hypothetical protein